MSDGGPKLLGRTIAGRFRITGVIGEGAMAVVYRGVQDAEPRDVAIKIMHAQLLGDQTFVTRFRREAKAAARLQHPNTVQTIDYGMDGRLPYIVMELVEGKDLFELLMTERRFGQARAARILIAISDALATAHEQGIVHRDLKPENVMISPDPARPGFDRVKVLDFGIAKIREREAQRGDDGGSLSVPSSGPSSLSTSALTVVGTVVGTPAYMSPEQCKGEPVDGRSDVYACGILLFLLVTGRLPFQPTAVPWEVAMEHIRKPPPAPSSFLPQIHPGLEAAILTALAKWPAQRQQSARELRDELTKLLPELPDVAPTSGVPVVPKDTPTGDGPRISVRGDPAPAPTFGAPPALGRHGTPPLGSKVRAPGSAPGSRPTDPDAATAPMPPALALGLPPRPSDPPVSAPPSSELEVYHRENFPGLADLAAAVGAGAAPRAAAPPPAAAPHAGAPHPGAAAHAPDDALARREETVPIRRRATRRPARPSETWAVKLTVPIALVIGLALGVLAFFLAR